MIRTKLILLPLIVLLLGGCTSDKIVTDSKPGCTTCHDTLMDQDHDFSCTTCHNGSAIAAEKTEAHIGLIGKPAHPDHMEKSCGPCHMKATEIIQNSLHYTLQNSTNIFRQIFGAKEKLPSFLDTPLPVLDPENIGELADDLLRRRCFRCHLFTNGDNYPATFRGTGCGACHLQFEDGKLLSHSFGKPSDKQCLSCHYGNYVGADFYGRFEHDFNHEYRTPYTTRQNHFRPYGVEYHQLAPDIHQQKSMVCIDCHSGSELMTTGGKSPSCKGCHKKAIIEQGYQENIVQKGVDFVFISNDGKTHSLPIMQHPVHMRSEEKIACQSCHAQWTFNDAGNHYLRSDTDNYDLFSGLAVQGSFEIEMIVDNNNDFDKDEFPLIMDDKLTKKDFPGLWHKGFTQRRWETILLGRDSNGVITPVRSLLDYHLSWIDEDDTVRFDSVAAQPNRDIMVPYVPHTTGNPGLYYSVRLQQFLKAEKSTRPNN